MDTSESKNFSKLAFILLEVVLNHLRDVFKEQWDKRYPNNPWLDDNISLQHFISQEQQGSRWKKNKSNMPNSGDRNDWDPSKLFFMLLYSSSINLPPACSLYAHINKLRELRNKHFGHPSKASLSNQEFEAIYKDIVTCMDGLNCGADMKQKMDDIKTGVIKLSENDVESMKSKIQTLNEKFDLVLQLVEYGRKHLKFMLKIIRGFVLALTLLSMVFLVLIIIALLFGHSTRIPKIIQSFHSKYIDKTGSHDLHIMRRSVETYFPESRKPNYYVGHTYEIETASNLLANRSYQMVSIVGAPAIGKTATAVAVGQTLRETRDFRVAFVDFKEIDDPPCFEMKKHIFKYILLSLGEDRFQEDTHITEVTEFVFNVRRLATQETLLILDNIENVLGTSTKPRCDDITQIIRACLSINNIKILSTSRKHFDVIGVHIHMIKLSPLSVDDSGALLRKCNLDLSKRSMEEISRAAGGIPLLLELIGSQLQSGTIEEEELVSRLKGTPILVIVNDTKAMTDSSNYYKLLKILFDSLEPDTQDTFIVLGTVPTSFNQATANAIVQISLHNKTDLSDLVSYNLLKKFKSSTEEIRYEMHQVIREFSALVAKENKLWSLRQFTSLAILFEYHNFHHTSLETFWSNLRNAVENPCMRKEDAEALSQQFALIQSSFHFFGEDKLMAVINKFIGLLNGNVEQHDTAIATTTSFLDRYKIRQTCAATKMSWYQNILYQMFTANTMYITDENQIKIDQDSGTIAKFAVDLAHQTLKNSTKILSGLKKTFMLLSKNQWSSLNKTLIQKYPGFHKMGNDTAFTIHTLGLVLYETGFYKESLDMFNIALAIAKQDPIKASYLMIHIGFAQYNIKSLTQAPKTLYKAVKMFMTSAETKLSQECKSKGAAFVDYKSDEEFDSMLVSNAAGPFHRK